MSPPNPDNGSRNQLAATLLNLDNGRYFRGLKIAETKRIRVIQDGSFRVPSDSMPEQEYIIALDQSGEFACSCPDHTENHVICKHIRATQIWIATNANIQDYIRSEIEPPSKPDCCPRCDIGSENIVGWGSSKGVKCYFCKNCHHRFRQQKLLKGFTYQTWLVCMALDLYFSGLSSRKVARFVRSHFHLKLHGRTVLRWTEKIIPIISEFVNSLEPKLSDTWLADELYQDLNQTNNDSVQTSKRTGKGVGYLWNILDQKTRFAISSTLSTRKGAPSAKKAFRTAVKNAHESLPEKIITDHLGSYNPAIYSVFKKQPVMPEHIRTGLVPQRKQDGKKYSVLQMERYQGTVRERTKVQRGWKSEDTVIPEGIRIHNNFVKPHMGLFGLTPADAALVSEGVPGTNKWRGLLQKAIENNNIKGKGDLRVSGGS